MGVLFDRQDQKSRASTSHADLPNTTFDR